MARGTNPFCASDEYFSAGGAHLWHGGQTHFALVTNALVLETNALKTRIQTSATHTAGYQRLSNKTYLEMTATHRYSPMKTSGSYLALVLTFKHATPTSYIHNSILCWTKRPSSRLLKLIEKTINKLLT